MSLYQDSEPESRSLETRGNLVMEWDPASIVGEIVKNTVRKLVDTLASRFLQSETDRFRIGEDQTIERFRTGNDEGFITTGGSLPGFGKRLRESGGTVTMDAEFQGQCQTGWITNLSCFQNNLFRESNFYEAAIADDFGCEIAIAYKSEVKKPGEECTPAQIVAQEEWRAVGVRVYVVYSKEDIRKIMMTDGFDLIN